MQWAVFCPRFDGAVYIFDIIRLEPPYTYEDTKIASSRNEKAAKIWIDYHMKDCTESKAFHRICEVLDPYDNGYA